MKQKCESSKMKGIVLVVVLCFVCGSQARDLPAEPKSSGLIDMFKEVLARASTTSEVLTLNLTNLVILLILKALIFGVGIFGFGAAGRSSDGGSPAMFENRDLIWMLTYIFSSSMDRYDCLNKLACKDPKGAQNYLFGSKMMLKGAKMMKGVIPYNSKYEHIVYGIQEAMENGGECDEVYYSCSHQF